MDRWTTKPNQKPVYDGIDENVVKKTQCEAILEF